MSTVSSWFASEWVPTESQAVARLVCLPHAGATYAAFASWPSFLSPDIEVRAVALPGRGQRFNEPLIRDMTTLMDGLALAVSKLTDLPVALYGSCMGAVSALALAKTLKEKFAVDVTHLFAASYPLLQMPSQLHRLPDDQFRSEILKFGFVPPEIAADHEIVDFYLPQIRADFELCETYLPDGTVLHCPITTLVGAADSLAEYSFTGWAPHTRAKWNHLIVNGGHVLSTEPSDEVRSTVRDILLRDIPRTSAAYPDSNSAP